MYLDNLGVTPIEARLISNDELVELKCSENDIDVLVGFMLLHIGLDRHFLEIKLLELLVV